VIQCSWPDNRVLASAPLDASGAIANTMDGDVAKQWYATGHAFAKCPPTKRALGGGIDLPVPR
jgi:hypothetical protein